MELTTGCRVRLNNKNAIVVMSDTRGNPLIVKTDCTAKDGSEEFLSVRPKDKVEPIIQPPLDLPKVTEG